MDWNKLIGVTLLFVIFSSITSCGKNRTQPVTKQSFYFDTVCQITIYDMDQMSEENAHKAIDQAFEQCSLYEQMLSKTIEGSDIWNVNHANGEPVVVQDDTMTLLQQGIHYGDLSNGRFDIMIGKAADLWDFKAEEPKLPDEEALAAAIQHVDYSKIVVDDTNNTVQLLDPEAEVDLGGIAKGYIADRVADMLEDANVTSAIISLGGNIECVGGKATVDGQSNFTIGIETPYSDMTQIVGAVPVNDGTVVTSGIYERYISVNGTEYHHILDPETGYSVNSDVVGVTIVGGRGKSSDCDALATTCLIYGSQDGLKLIESLDGFEAAFILRDESIVETSGMNLTKTK